MNNIDKILERLYSALHITKDKEFCDKYNVKANTVSSWKKRNSIPYELIQEISHNENISLDWLLTGKGSMHLEEKQTSSSHNTVGDNSIVVNGNGSIHISISKEDFKDDSEDIKKLVSLLKYAPKSFIAQIIERLEKFKELSQI